MSLIEQALPGILAPALTAGLVALLVGGLFSRKEGSDARARFGVALGVGLGYLVGHRLIAGSWPPVPFGESTLSAQQWRLYAAGAGALVGGLLGLRRWSLPLSFLTGGVWIAVVLRAVLDARFRHQWEVQEGALIVAGIAAGAALVRVFVDRRADRGGPFEAFELWAMAAGTAGCFQIAHNSSNAQLAGALAAAVAAVGVLAAWAPRASLSQGGSAVVLALLAAMWVEGPLYGDVPIAAVVAIALTPLLRSLVRGGGEPGQKGAGPTWLEVVIVLAVVGIGVGCAVLWTPERVPYMP